VDQLAEDDRVVLVDVRQPSGFAEEHIPGAINLPLNTLRAGEPALAEAQSIVVYASGSPEDPLAGAAAKRLLALGYSNVLEFRGGLDEWTTKGGRTVSGEGADASAD
jgi:rhodanese-related sulfurtransferase